MNIRNKNHKSGVALLIAVLVSSVFFTIAAAIFKIALIEYVLSSTGRDSQFAFYSADTGAECALFWDRHFPQSGSTINPGDGTGSAFNFYATDDGTDGGSQITGNRTSIVSAGSSEWIKCGGAAVEKFCRGDTDAQCTSGTATGFDSQTFFRINNGTICADVVVSKLVSPADSPAITSIANKTTIVSTGYNTCDASSPKRVSRQLQVTLQ